MSTQTALLGFWDYRAGMFRTDQGKEIERLFNRLKQNEALLQSAVRRIFHFQLLSRRLR